MASYYKNARRWEREYQAKRSAGTPDLTFVRDKASGEFKLPPKRPTAVPRTGQPPGTTPAPVGSPSHFKKQWRDLPANGANPLGRYRGMATGMLGFLGEQALNPENWDPDAWDNFMENGDLPEGFDFLNPGPDALERFQRMNGIPVGQPGASFSPEQRVDFMARQIYVENICPPPFGFSGPGRFAQAAGACGVLHSGEIPFMTFMNSAVVLPMNVRNTDYDPGGIPAPGFNKTVGNHWARQRFWRGVDLNNKLTNGNQVTNLEQIMDLAVPKGVVAPTSTPPRFNFMPGLPFSGYALPDVNMNVPARHRKAWNVARQIAGTRFDSGYNTDVEPWVENPTVQVPVTLPVTGSNRPPPSWPPPVITKPSEPYKPPGSKPDRKAMIRGRSLFNAVQKGFHGLTEYQDFIESFYDALPKKYQTCKIGGPACQTAQVLAHWDEVDIPTAVVNWLWNNFEDAVLGRGFGKLDNAAKRLGTRDWKLLNSANGSPLDEGLGELYGEFVKEHVNPTKKDFVNWAKENLLQ